MPAVRPPTFWLSVAATTITAVAVASMVMSAGPRRPLSFAGAILLPGNQSSAAASPSPQASHPRRPGRPPATRTTAGTAAPAPPSSYPVPVAVLAPAAAHSTASSPPGTRATRPAAAGAPAPTSPGRTPAADAGPVTPVSSPTATGVAQALFTALNAARTRAGLPALAWSARLQRSAASHNAAMAAADQLAPRLGAEPALGVRQADQGVLGSYAAELVGYSPTLDLAGALAAQRAMLAGQQAEDLPSGTLTAAGIDVLVDPVHGRLWITEDFARLP